MISPIKQVVDFTATGYQLYSKVFGDPIFQIGRFTTLTKVLPKKVKYNDTKAEFHGGELELLVHTNYEKALRNLWKVNEHLPDLDIRDSDRTSVVDSISNSIDAIESKSFKKQIYESFSKEERIALSRILSVILHGEAYALYVSSSLLPIVKGTGGKLGMATQVLEEAKHFIVLRKLVQAIHDVHPQSVYETILLEEIAKANPIDRLFGMNIVLETIALNIFSSVQDLPALDKIIPLFHLDESRHCAFPVNYRKLVTPTLLEKANPIHPWNRVRLIAPLIPTLLDLEPYFSTLEIDVFSLGIDCIKHIFSLSTKANFELPYSEEEFVRLFTLMYHTHKRVSDPKFSKLKVLKSTPKESKASILNGFFLVPVLEKALLKSF